MILLGESSSGEVSADLRMVPLVDELEVEEEEVEVSEEGEFELVVLEAGEFEEPEFEDAEVVGVVEAELEAEELGEPAEVAAGEVDDELVEAVERADERDELLSESADELSVNEAVS